MKIIVMLGAPGSGKGTQAVQLAKELNIPHISTGEIFRYNIKNQTELGIKVQALMDNGSLCPDDLTAEIVKERIMREDCVNGCILDGFPRNLTQAELLDGIEGAEVDVAINLDIDTAKLMKRLTGRRSCQKCGGNYHIDFIVGDKERCPVCGEPLIIRKDDNEETVKNRLEVYETQTAPVITYYKNQNKLINVDGDKAIGEVFVDILRKLK